MIDWFWIKGESKYRVILWSVWSTPATPQGEAESWGSLPPNFRVPCLGGGWWWACVSAFPTRFDVGIFLVARCVGVTLVISGFLPEETVVCVALYLVHLWEEGNSGTSCIPIFVMFPGFLSISQKQNIGSQIKRQDFLFLEKLPSYLFIFTRADGLFLLHWVNENLMSY